MKKITLLLISAVGFALQSSAQTCTLLDTAVQTPIVLNTVSGTDNRSGVAWNPIDSLYYSVNAGSGTYPIETYDAGGGASVASVAAGISFRGLWWNAALDQLEGNGHGTTGWRNQDLDAITGYGLGTGTAIYSGQLQPNTQSCGDLDYDANEVIFYDNGLIYRYDRATGASISNYALNNMPVSTADITDYGVVYTGCVGQEIGIYDYTNMRLLLFDKATGDFADSVQLPAGAPQIPSFGMSFANDLFWLYDGPADVWYSYQIYPSCTPDYVTDTLTACDSLVWIDGNTYTASNFTAMDTLTNAVGCDSIITLNLTITNSTAGTDVVTACGSYMWIDSNTYTSSNNTATFTLTNAAGCDSLVTLDLTINPMPDINVTQTGTELSADQASASYEWLDCDSNYASVGVTTQSYIPLVTGNYAVLVDLNGCVDTSSCFLVDYTGLSEIYKDVVTLYPNPANDVVTVSGLDAISGFNHLRIVSTSGAIVHRQDSKSEMIDVSKLETGMYFLFVAHESGEECIKFMIE